MTILSFDWPGWLKVAVDVLIIIISYLSGHALGAFRESFKNPTRKRSQIWQK